MPIPLRLGRIQELPREECSRPLQLPRVWRVGSHGWCTTQPHVSHWRRMLTWIRALSVKLHTDDLVTDAAITDAAILSSPSCRHKWKKPHPIHSRPLQGCLPAAFFFQKKKNSCQRRRSHQHPPPQDAAPLLKLLLYHLLMRWLRRLHRVTDLVDSLALLPQRPATSHLWALVCFPANPRRPARWITQTQPAA